MSDDALIDIAFWVAAAPFIAWLAALYLMLWCEDWLPTLLAHLAILWGLCVLVTVLEMTS